MSVLVDHAGLLDELWDRLEGRLRSYPSSIDDQVAGLRAYIDAPSRTYFNRPDAPPLLHLVMWLGVDLERATLVDILEATALLYLFVRIQDDILDEPDTRGHTDWLLLGNALLWDGIDLLRRRVEHHDFWAVSRGAWLQFCGSTARERTRLLREEAGTYREDEFEQDCRKVALAEIPLLAVLALDTRFEMRDHVGRLVADLGVAYGLTNDIVGFRRDVAANMRTHLIDRVRAHVPAERWSDGEAMCRALLDRSHLETFFRRARNAHRRAARHAKKLGLSQFPKFTAERLERLFQLEREALIARLSATLANETSERCEEYGSSTTAN